MSATSENKMAARLRLGRRVLFWTTIRRGLTAAGAMFGHHFHSFVFIGAQSDTSPIRKHEPLIGTNLLDCVFSHFSAQPAENLRIHGRAQVGAAALAWIFSRKAISRFKMPSSLRATSRWFRRIILDPDSI
jgi:hypothetical protein